MFHFEAQRVRLGIVLDTSGRWLDANYRVTDARFASDTTVQNKAALNLVVVFRVFLLSGRPTAHEITNSQTANFASKCKRLTAEALNPKASSGAVDR